MVNRGGGGDGGGGGGDAVSSSATVMVVVNRGGGGAVVASLHKAKSLSKAESIKRAKTKARIAAKTAQFNTGHLEGRFKNSELFKERPIGSADSEQSLSVALRLMNFCV